MRILPGAIAGFLLAAGAASPAFAACTNCVSTAGHKASSVIPADRGRVNRNGDSFTNAFTLLNLSGNRSTQVSLGFNVNIGGAVFNSVNVNENGALSFGAAIGQSQVSRSFAASSTGGNPPFIPVSSLKELGVPVVAPFYADLLQETSEAGREPALGQIFVQYGLADPVPDERGVYSTDDLLQAVRITWYGLSVRGNVDTLTNSLVDGSANATSNLAFAQILITDQRDGSFNFEFRTGDPSGDGAPSQPGLGSIAGFALPGGAQDFTGPYDDSTPSYFAFRDGALAAVPEPATWTMLIVGFGLAGGAMRYRRRERYALTA